MKQGQAQKYAEELVNGRQAPYRAEEVVRLLQNAYLRGAKDSQIEIAKATPHPARM